MKKVKRWILLINLFILILLSPVYALDSIILDIKKENNYLLINTNIKPSQEFFTDFQNGLSKSILVTIELYRRWSIIPDEFITGLQIQRNMLSDPIKGEFIVKSIYGENTIEKRFNNCEDAMNWALKIESIRIGNINYLEKGRYYVKISVESNIRKLPLVLEHILFFIPTHERKITKESEIFRLP